MRLTSSPFVLILLLAAFSFVAYHKIRERWFVCEKDTKLCLNGLLLERSGPQCEFPDCTEDEIIYSEILWNTPLHSWTGVASEAVDFLVPLASRLPNLAVVGGYSQEYIAEYGNGDAQVITHLRDNGITVSEKRLMKENDDSAASIYITQYDPGTYKDDYTRHRCETFDYLIGRVMFETTSIPSNWISACSDWVDELWVPSTWGKDCLIKSGVPERKIAVIPQSIDVIKFDPKVVKHDHSLLPGSENAFSFLSIFKWEDRKNYQGLLRAFITTFDGDDSVALYIRSGKSADQLKGVVEEFVDELNVIKCPKIVWLAHVENKKLPQLYATADSFVLPTHGEGWGRPIMEAMAMELPTIATYWGGSTAFLTDDNAFLLHPHGVIPGYTEEKQIINFDDSDKHLWANVSESDLGKIMKFVKNKRNRHVVDEVRSEARKTVVKHFSREPVADVVMQQLMRVQKKILNKKQVRRNEGELKDL
eukprot:m.332278 g.332278  ORF g.332278 m.332278 type:complete len:477 (+) comp16915_c0_seq1:238-1668(+)